MNARNALAAVATAIAAISTPVHADVLGMADLAINQFLLVSNGQPVTTGIQINSEGRTGNASSLYNGTQSSATAIGFGSAVTDVTYKCNGPACGSIGGAYGGVLENNSTTHINSVIGNYALGDMLLAGSAIGPQGTGANALTRANAAADGPSNQGSANATILNGVTATTTFTATTTIDVNFLLSFDAFVKVLANPDAGSSDAFASAGNSWILSVTSSDDAGFVPLLWQPSQLNVAYTADGPEDNKTFSAVGTIFSPTRTLASGKSYELTIVQASNSVVRELPEPASLLLAGAALVGLGVARRRRSV